MDFRRLRYFVKIVEAGSLSRAALALYIAQPSLSHQVSLLEKDLGVPLLDRNHRGIKPTPAGLVLYRNAQSILRQVEQTRSDVRSESSRVSGSVSIGLPSSVAEVLALPLLESVLREYPEVSLEINDSTSGVLAELLSNGRLDLAVLYTDSNPRDIDALTIFTESLCLVEPKSADLSGPRSGESPDAVPLTALHGMRLLGSPSINGLRQFIDQTLARENVVPTVIADLGTLHMMRSAVLAGIAATILPLSTVFDDWIEGRLTVRRIVDPPIARRVSLCTNRNLPLGAAAQAIRAKTLESIAALAQSGKWPGIDGGPAAWPLLQVPAGGTRAASR